MPGRGRRVVVALVVLALVLSAGRWGAAFFADRLWESGISARVAAAGGRLALIRLSLELALLLLAGIWLFLHLTIAARIALPDRPPPERDSARVWPAQLPRWTLAVLAIVLAVVLGDGGGEWRDPLLLTLDGVRVGLRDPLLSADLGVFLRQVPLWLELQHRATVLVIAALCGVLLLHLTGETIRFSKWRPLVWPRARAQLALLLVLLALCLGWGAWLEPNRLAAGLHGPLLPSEFAFQNVVTEVVAALALLTAVLSLCWWLGLRGTLVAGAWLLLGAALLASRGLRLRADSSPDRVIEDPAWLGEARVLDSFAFQLAGLDSRVDSAAPPADSLAASLWDASVLSLAVPDSATLSEPKRGWIRAGGRQQPVWLAVRQRAGQDPELIAASETLAPPGGALLAWHADDSVPSPGVAAFKRLRPGSVRPAAERIRLASDADGPGVRLDGWVRRVMLAWALQTGTAISASSGTRIAWRLDPAMRLRAVAPFASWVPPRPRMLGAELVWQSDGLLVSDYVPSSTRVEWGARRVSMIRSAFVGVVYAGSGEVRIFRRDPADSLSAAWARIARPMIEAPDSIPRELREGEAYPEELVLAQAKVLEGPAWNAGSLERLADGTPRLPPAAPGGSRFLVPLIVPATGNLSALLSARRTAAGDSLQLFRVDTAWKVEGSARLIERWKLFPFQQGLDDSVRAAGGRFETGRVRFALTREGIAAYQPAWAIDDSSHVNLVLLNVALVRTGGAGRPWRGTGRTLADAWRNARGEIAAGSATNAQAILEEARRLVLQADSARKRGDLQELQRTLAALRALLERRRP